MLLRLADAVSDVTLDSAAFEAQGQARNLNIQDRELLRRLEALD